jgi:hypothetical protein
MGTLLCGGNVPLEGGTSDQKKYKIEDSPGVPFRDITDWSIVEINGIQRTVIASSIY